MVELVDTPDSKSCERKLVTVQVRPAAPFVQNRIPYGLRVKTASGSLQGNLHLKACFQSRSFGVARGDQIPPPAPFAKNLDH